MLIGMEDARVHSITAMVLIVNYTQVTEAFTVLFAINQATAFILSRELFRTSDMLTRCGG